MLRSKFMGPAALVVAVVLALAVPLSGQERKKAEAAGVKGTLLSVDAAKNSVTLAIHTFNRATGIPADVTKTFSLTKDARVLVDDVAVPLADLKKGYPIALKLAGDSAVSVDVHGGTAQGEFQSANLTRGTIAVIGGRDPSRRVYHLLKETRVTTDTGKSIEVRDLQPGTKLLLTRSIEDDNTVIRIQTLPAARKQ